MEIVYFLPDFQRLCFEQICWSSSANWFTLTLSTDELFEKPYKILWETYDGLAFQPFTFTLNSLRSHLFRFLLAGESERPRRSRANARGESKKRNGGEGVGRKGKAFPFLPCPSPLPQIFCHLCPRALAQLPLA